MTGKMTGKMIRANGIPILIPNDITDDTVVFHISYNERDKHIHGDVTTALVSNNPVKFLVLCGDHTKQYKKIISRGGDYNDCVQYFKGNESLKAKYSENWDEMTVFEGGNLKVIKDSKCDRGILC